MGDGGSFFAGVLAGAVFLIIIIANIGPDQQIEEPDYRQGQIDALTGTIHYELITNPDSTKTWEFKE